MIVIRDWWISIRFVCFVFQGSLLCDGPVSGNNRLVNFASHIFIVFLILVTCKNKAVSASFLRKKIYSPSRFPSLFLSRQSRVILSQAGRARYIVICINLPSLKWLTKQKNPKSLLSFKNAQRDSTNFAVIVVVSVVLQQVLAAETCYLQFIWQIHIQSYSV